MTYEVMEWLSQRAKWEVSLTASADLSGNDWGAIGSFKPETVEVYHNPDNIKFFGVAAKSYNIIEGTLHGRRAFMVICPAGDESLTGIFYI